MSQIEVPDWVARIADEAGEEFARTHTMSMYASLADMQLDCVRHMLNAALGAWVVREPYRVGNRYMTQGGEEVTLNQVANYGTSYESMCDDAGVHRYTRRDFGRVTGSAHDYSDQRNIPPLYTLRQEKPDVLP
jgi:hypothetical protein